MAKTILDTKSEFTAADQVSPWLTLRGDFHHEFFYHIWGSFVGTVTLQCRQPDDDTSITDLEEQTAPRAKWGRLSGSMDVRLTVKSGAFTSGPIGYSLKR